MKLLLSNTGSYGKNSFHVLALILLLTACGQAPGVNQEGQQGLAGLNGQDGSNGNDGANGADGQDGARGVVGAAGTPGVNGSEGPKGSGCTVKQTSLGALIQCGDGTSAVVLNGSNGHDGTNCVIPPKPVHTHKRIKHD